ncbi:uncharacterized protein LOC114543235 [Dendronephthya gigantea]|uniref:uncharacterized protein LOC114543235 n=1 Tax=Dendronephthya gigantea TaxID=151771 RepID=UPI00106A1534|nr:uncharacterized protein LOC114543235 [Dendronephthya gigantea]
MLFKDYKLLDKFSPAVTNALEHNCLSQTQRSEFIRDICTDISSSGVYFLNKAERNQVALAIVTKYPHLKDSIGSGLGSWSESIKNRFKHVRKYASKKRKNSAMNDGDSETRDTSVHASNPSKPRKMDFWNIIPNPVGTESIQNDHLAEMQKECQKPRMAQDKNKIKELMNVTYDLRRKEILTTTVPVKEIIKKYPPLASVNGLRYEFCRIMEDDCATKDIKERFSSYRACDMPASKKVCGFTAHNSKRGCNKCTKEFVTGGFGDATDYSGFNSSSGEILLTIGGMLRRF